MITLRIILAINCFTVSVFCLTAGEIEAQRSGWNLSPNTQYHIQTDEGPERYFRYQTLNGQYRKEKRLADGTVVGTEGWLDPLGYLRIKDYIADTQGYRILRSKMVYVGKDRPIQDAVSISKKVPAQSGILAKPRRPINPFRQPEVKDLPGNSIEANTVTPLNPTASAPVHPGIQYQGPISTPAAVIPPSTLYSSISTSPSPYRGRVHFNQLEDGYSQPNTNYLPTHQYRNPYISPYQNPYPYQVPGANPSQPSVVFQPPLYGEKYLQSNQLLVQNQAASPAGSGYYQAQNSQGYETAPAASHAYQSSQDYYSNHNGTQQGSQIGRIVQASDRAGPAEQRVGEFPEYDGTHTVKDGFQYYLKTHYHEEEKKPEEDKKIGSFGYIDPFGIRRVIYYQADAEHGFLHKKNNRYVGFQATPYDPQLSDRS